MTVSTMSTTKRCCYRSNTCMHRHACIRICCRGSQLTVAAHVQKVRPLHAWLYSCQGLKELCPGYGLVSKLADGAMVRSLASSMEHGVSKTIAGVGHAKHTVAGGIEQGNIRHITLQEGSAMSSQALKTQLDDSLARRWQIHQLSGGEGQAMHTADGGLKHAYSSMLQGTPLICMTTWSVLCGFTAF